MPPAAFEPQIPASEWTHTYALDRVATGIGTVRVYSQESCLLHKETALGSKLKP